MIYIHNEYDEIIESFTGPGHMYEVMKSRYVALKKKRYKEINRAYNQGLLYGTFITACGIISIFLIFKLFIN